MQTTDFITCCGQLSPLDARAQQDLLAHTKTRIFKKGECLLNAGEVCNHVFFVKEGLAKVWAHRHDKEVTHCFFSEATFFSVFDSYLDRKPSNYLVSALEDTAVVLMQHDAVNRLSATHHCIETLFKKIADYATVSMIRRITEILEEDAPSRYRSFLAENPALASRITLGELAKYLGITQQSLSRIRSQERLG